MEAYKGAVAPQASGYCMPLLVLFNPTTDSERREGSRCRLGSIGIICCDRNFHTEPALNWACLVHLSPTKKGRVRMTYVSYLREGFITSRWLGNAPHKHVSAS
jgi:hypothetical protein